MPKQYTRKIRRRGAGLVRMNAKRNILKSPNNTVKNTPSYSILKNRYQSLMGNNPVKQIPIFHNIPNIPISPIVTSNQSQSLQERFNRLAKMKGQ